jgi:hypothetical protein
MELFFEILHVALGQRDKLSHNPSNEEWTEIYELAQKQAIAGCLFLAIDILSQKGQKPSLPLLYEWIALAEHIKQRNLLLNQRCIELMRMFVDAGFDSCILKGQGNALMYPDPLLRQTGDIDIWVKGKRDEIIEFCKTKAKGKVSVHHVELPIWKDLEVEVHFVPSYTKVPRFANRTQNFFEKFGCEEIDGRGLLGNGVKMYVPTKEMNMVFQMSHMARHFFYEGIGLRHLMDYYYLLKYDGDVDFAKVRRTLQDLGLYKFASGVMWVLDAVFGMDEKCVFLQVDERRGRLLLDEVMKGGNFGRHEQGLSGMLSRKNTMLSIIYRSERMAWLFPEEAFWSPVSWACGYFKRHKFNI